MDSRFIQTQKLYSILDFEAFIFLIVIALLGYGFYKILLKNASAERHHNIKNHIKELVKYYVTLIISFSAYQLAQSYLSDYEMIKFILPYLGVICFIVGALCFVKASRLIVLLYLFLGSMRAGVPLLLVNIFSLVLTIFIGFWTINNIFGVHVTPIIATSAAFSIILGLALQDTLGNLIAGISLQIDKTFEIGDWLEVVNGPNKIIGQVHELTWRSTVMVGLSDEMITLPNKLVSQCQVSNFSPDGNPIVRSHLFKFAFQVDIQKVLVLLERATSQVVDIRPQPAPFAFVTETNDYGISVKIIYFIDNYGKQFSIGDKVVRSCLSLLAENGIQTAKPSIQVQNINT